MHLAPTSKLRHWEGMGGGCMTVKQALLMEYIDRTAFVLARRHNPEHTAASYCRAQFKWHRSITVTTLRTASEVHFTPLMFQKIPIKRVLRLEPSWPVSR